MSGPAGPPRIGVFGGTFDPPHVGHLIVARDAAEGLGLDRLLLMVAPQPPHKSGAALSPAELRLEMTRAAVAGDPVLQASDLEFGRPGPSYTVDTLARLAAGHPDAALFLLMGADQWREIGSWKDPAGIARLATLAVLNREGGTPPAAEGPEGLSCTAVPVTRIDLSSTEVRARVRAGRTIRYLVPEPVRAIIERERLYQAPTARQA